MFQLMLKVILHRLHIFSLDEFVILQQKLAQFCPLVKLFQICLYNHLEFFQLRARSRLKNRDYTCDKNACLANFFFFYTNHLPFVLPQTQFRELFAAYYKKNNIHQHLSIRLRVGSEEPLGQDKRTERNIFKLSREDV